MILLTNGINFAVFNIITIITNRLKIQICFRDTTILPCVVIFQFFMLPTFHNLAFHMKVFRKTKKEYKYML